MQSLTRQQLETILDELTIFRIDGSLSDLCTVITFIIEKRMTDPVEVNTDLMGSSCLKTALYYCHISETLKHLVMCDCMLSMVSIREHLESHTVVRIASDIAYDRSLIIFEVTPYYRHITALD